MDAISQEMLNEPIDEQAVKRFANAQHLAGWYHNPYKMQDAKRCNDPDVVATRIAEHYIELFTEALRKRGYMPFTGIEINFDAHSARYKAADKLERKLASKLTDIGLYLAVYQKFGEEEAAHFMALKQFLMSHSPGNIQSRTRKKMIDELRDGVTYLSSSKAFLELSEELDTEDQMDEEWRDALSEYTKLLSDATDKLSTVPCYNAMAKYEGIYVDNGNVEVCTPPLLPIETVKMVNFYKRIFFEASDDFSNAFDKERPEAADPHRHYLANWIKNGLDRFNITFTNGAQFSGEHVNLSLQYDPERHKGYDTALDEPSALNKSVACKNSTPFSYDNLMRSSGWQWLVRNVFQEYLSKDKVLTIGLPLATPPGVSIKRPFKIVEKLTDDKRRVETRNFHFSGSNAALSMVGMLANLYAMVTAAEKVDPEFAKEFANAGKETEGYAKKVMEQLKQMQSAGNDPNRAYTGLEDSFKQEGLTLKMMREVNQEMFADNQRELNEHQVACKKFEELVCRRARDIMQGQDVQQGVAR